MSDGPNRQVKARTRPGILKVFWPAFLSWGTLAFGVWMHRDAWRYLLTADLQPGFDAVLTGIILLAPLAALGVTLLYREARSPVALVLNATTIIPILILLTPR